MATTLDIPKEILNLNLNDAQGPVNDGLESEEHFDQLNSHLLNLSRFLGKLVNDSHLYWNAFTNQAERALNIAEDFNSFFLATQSEHSILASSNDDLHAVARYIHSEQLVRKMTESDSSHELEDLH